MIMASVHLSLFGATKSVVCPSINQFDGLLINLHCHENCCQIKFKIKLVSSFATSQPAPSGPDMHQLEQSPMRHTMEQYIMISE